MADQPKINLNLDELEAPGKEPYTFALKGRTYTVNDPSELDWQVVESLTTMDAITEHCMSDEDRKAFYATPLATYRVGFLFDDILKHFELGNEYSKRKRH